MIRVRPGLEEAYTWAEFCSVIVHERNHTAGLGHSPDPRSNIFAGNVGDALGPPHAPACGVSDAELERREERLGELRECVRELR